VFFPTGANGCKMKQPFEMFIEWRRKPITTRGGMCLLLSDERHQGIGDANARCHTSGSCCCFSIVTSWSLMILRKENFPAETTNPHTFSWSQCCLSSSGTKSSERTSAASPGAAGSIECCIVGPRNGRWPFSQPGYRHRYKRVCMSAIMKSQLERPKENVEATSVNEQTENSNDQCTD